MKFLNHFQWVAPAIVTADTILEQYQLWQKSGETRRFKQQSKIEDWLIFSLHCNQEVFYQLIFSGNIPDWKTLYYLLALFGSNKYGAFEEEVQFLRRVYERIDELPETMQIYFSWLKDCNKLNDAWKMRC